VNQELCIPAVSAPAWHRFAIRFIQALPAGRFFAFRFYRKVSRLLRPSSLANTYFGATMECDLNDLISSCIHHFGVWEPHISAVIQSGLAPGDVFCDIGANIGYDSLLASLLVGREGKVIAVEPSPRTYAKLVRNLVRNQASNVRTVMAAVTEARCTIPLYVGQPGNAGSASLLRSRGGVKECDVNGLPLGQIISPDEWPRLRLVKIDVEGAEMPILRALLDEIPRCRRDIEVVVEMSTPDRAAKDAIFRRFAASGFRAYLIPNSYDIEQTYLRFRGIEPPRALPAPRDEQGDILFSRDEASSAA
jgi:FkbM family methyltransferase